MRVILCGYYGQDNAGDEALLVTLLQLLPPSVTPVVFSTNPPVTSARYGVEAYPNRHWPTVWRELRRADGFIWGGGSLMQDVTSFTSPLYYAGLMAIAQWLGLKTIAWAQGIGPLNRPPIRWLTRWVLSGCTGISVRDQASAALLKRWQLPCQVAPDPVWLLAAVPPATQPPSLTVAVNLRQHPLLTPERQQLLTAALIHFQQQTQARIRLIPFQETQDFEIAQAIAAQLPGPSELLYRADPRQCKGLFHGVKLAIGMRLHSLIMAASEGCCCFGLSYDPKVSRLMTEVGLPGWELTELPPSSVAISGAWQRALTQEDPLTPQQQQQLREKVTIHQALLENILLTGGS